MIAEFEVSEEKLPELEKFRSMHADYHDLVLQRATEMKEPNEADFMMAELYRGLGTNGRKLANMVLSEWLDSGDTGRQFTAFGLIREFKITEAIPSLKNFIQVHRSPINAVDRYDLERAIQALERCQAEDAGSIGTKQ